MALTATTVREALNTLATGSTELHNHLFDSSNQLNRFVRVFVEGRQTNLGRQTTPGLSQEETVADGAVVTIVLALAGG